MLRLFIVLILFFLIDLYTYHGLKFLSRSGMYKKIFVTFFWTLSALCLLLLTIVFVIRRQYPQPELSSWPEMLLSLIQSIYIAKLLSLPLLMLDDIRRFVIKISLWMRSPKVKEKESTSGNSRNAIPRSAFLSWAAGTTGVLLFGTLMIGLRNKYAYQVKRMTLSFLNLPAAFHQFKIVQISDIHVGSFDDPKAVQAGVEMVMNEHPDMIVFTGDLVNNRASEIKDYLNIFSTLKAPFGVYSILGNHDYGDYVEWPSAELKAENLQLLKRTHAELRWKLLLNEHVEISKQGHSIALLGVENWGEGNFSKYGKMEDAYNGTESYPFKILLSHDPSHWDAEIRKKYPDIDLTLSGHTHGLQFGVENSFIKWSPAQWFYKQWAGLYIEDQQKLYINRGFGFIGYQGRVGILPEISVITLTKPS